MPLAQFSLTCSVQPPRQTLQVFMLHGYWCCKLVIYDSSITCQVTGAGHKPKTLSLVVTPYKRSCQPHDRRYKRCGASKHCIRSVKASIFFFLSFQLFFFLAFLLFFVIIFTITHFRSELFCDGTVNCAVNTKVPQGKQKVSILSLALLSSKIIKLVSLTSFTANK